MISNGSLSSTPSLVANDEMRPVGDWLVDLGNSVLYYSCYCWFPSCGGTTTTTKKSFPWKVSLETRRLFLEYRGHSDKLHSFIIFIILYTMLMGFIVTRDVRNNPSTFLTLPMIVMFVFNHLITIINIVKKTIRKYHIHFYDSSSSSSSSSLSSLKQEGDSGDKENNNEQDGTLSYTSTSNTGNRSSSKTTGTFRLGFNYNWFNSTPWQNASNRRNSKKVYVTATPSSANADPATRVVDIEHGHQRPSSNPDKTATNRTISNDQTQQQQHQQQQSPLLVSEWDIFLENLNYFTFIFSIDLYLAYLTIVRYEFNVFNASLPGADTKHLQPGIAELTMAMPIFMYMLLRCITFGNIFIGIIATFLLHVILEVNYDLTPSSYTRSLLALAFIIFIVIEYQCQAWHDFQVQHRLHQILVENARLAEEIKANELRHMIGNVAHDLKTPLSSFISGMEVIKSVAGDLRNQHGKSTISEVEAQLSTILEVAENVTNTNAFMIMTINRCIDYNKTLFGLKLTPRHEVFLLKDSVNFTVSCLRNSYEHCKIECCYKNEELKGGDVIMRTDKQWFMENLLCLLGNAVKYSDKGSVVQMLVNIEGDIAIKKQKTNSTGGECLNPSKQSQERSTSSRAVAKDKHLFIEILDTGKGIPESERSKLFDEPVQVAREFGGSGLGLYSLSKRVEALGGYCGVTGRKDGLRGSRFWFAIPWEIVKTKNKESLCCCATGDTKKSNNFDEEINCTNGNMRCSTKNYLDSSPKLESTVVANLGLTNHHCLNMTSQASTPAESFCISPHESVARIQSMASQKELSILKCVTEEQDCAYDSTIINLSANDALPRKVSEQPAISMNHNNQNIERQHLLDRPLKILIVDDSPPILKMTSLALKKQGHSVVTAENGQLAVDLYTNEMSKLLMDTNLSVSSLPFDVIIMDFQMPIMGGVQAIVEIRNFEQKALSSYELTAKGTLLARVGVAIVGFSAKSDEEQIDEAYANGMNAFLPKPFTVAGFQSILQHL